jgi:predicted pyridoxine 5'-phosphate oxidase superfamily flavin-nucleotide-binding protein
MAKLTEEMVNLISDQKVCFVATADRERRVNVSPKGSIMVVDDETLAFADCYSKKTRANLRVNPNIALAVVDTKAMRGFQFRGKAQLIEGGDLYSDVVVYLETLPLDLPNPEYVVKVTVEEIFDLRPGMDNSQT